MIKQMAKLSMEELEMSVRKSDRDENILQAELETKALVVSTIRICSNPKLFPTNLKWVLSNKIISIATTLYDNVRKANAIRVNNVKDANKREKLQEDALDNLTTLQTLMTLAVECYEIPPHRIEIWTKLYNNANKYIKGWHKADKKKYDKEFGQR